MKQVLVVRLQSDSHRFVKLGHELYPVVGQSETEVEVDLALRDLYVNSKKFINKEDLNKVHHVEIFSSIDDKKYWFIEAYAYVKANGQAEETLKEWREKVKEEAKKIIKNRNQLLKIIFNSIESA